jgi:hypothetical protein
MDVGSWLRGLGLERYEASENHHPVILDFCNTICQKQTHAPQQTACVLQVQVTKMAAQSSGNAFTGAVDDAISEGFSEGRGHKFES